ncbi:unnamed protein product [Calicophoron daubneyi]|uniref:Protein ECT2 n=1 Tax=Calicophoron daubneyi TaxID=300641 RepID=A0AAV2TDJ3_CALDB
MTTQRTTSEKAFCFEAPNSQKGDSMLNADVDSVDAPEARFFQGTSIAFVGFASDSEELLKMCNLVLEHGGTVTSDLHDKRLTHVVVADLWPDHRNTLDELKSLIVCEASSADSPNLSVDPSVYADQNTNLQSPSMGTHQISMVTKTYRVPVVRPEWFSASLQLGSLAQVEPYLYFAGQSESSKWFPKLSASPIPLPPLAKPVTISPVLKEHAISMDISRVNEVSASPSVCNFDSLSLKDELIRENELSPVQESYLEDEIPMPSSGGTISEDSEKKNHTSQSSTHVLNSSKQLWEKVLGRRSGGNSSSPVECCSPLHPTSTERCSFSFVTSPSRRNGSRGFISPPGDRRNSSDLYSHSHRGKTSGCGSVSGASSHDSLLTQLADPLNFPSNRERRLCQLAFSRNKVREADGRELDSSCCTHTVDVGMCHSSVSFNSDVLLDTTSNSEYNTSSSGMNRGSHGVSSLIRSLRDTGTVVEDVTAHEPAIKSTVNQPLGGSTQSTPASGKRKSTSRISLLHSTARKSRTPVTDLTESSPTNVSSASAQLTGDPSTPIRVRLEKRQHRVFEFFVTEHNYLDILRYLYRVAYPQVLTEDQSGGPILPRQEADYVFGKLGPILDLHERMQPQLDQLESNWSSFDSRLGDVLRLDLLEEMDKAYGNYMQFYSPPHLHHLGEQYPRFLTFMRQVERRKESGRQSLAALLVRPVQRLPSIALLMEGIVKFTPNSHPDYIAMKQFASGLNNLLVKINDRLKKNEERLSLLSLYHEISGAPPEMLSSSRSLVARLDVFELGTSSSGHTTCEPVTLFLLTDSLEVARPRKRHTGEPLAHALRAALAAVQGDVNEHNLEVSRDQVSSNLSDPNPATSGASSITHTNSSVGDGASNPNGVTSGGVTVTVTRTGSDASGTSLMNLGLIEGKQRCCYKHLQLLKLHEIKRVVNFDTASPDRAAFGLVVRASSEADDRMHAYCLAASFAASAAVATGRCPEPVESAVAAATVSGGISVSEKMATVADTSIQGANGSNSAHVATLQACVSEAKRSFLSRLCQLIVQVSCLANNPDELLVDVEPEELLGFDLEQVFNATAQALKSKKFSRQLTRNISVKTPRRPVTSSKWPFSLTPHTPAYGTNQQGFQRQPEELPAPPNPITSPRRSVIGSLLGHRGPSVPADRTSVTLDPSANCDLERFSSTPLRDSRKCAATRPPPTPTADQVAMAMLNLIRIPRSTAPQPSDLPLTHEPTPSLFDDYGDDYPEADSISMASSNFNDAFWPPYAKQSQGMVKDRVRRTFIPAVSSTTSLRSATLELGPTNNPVDSVTSLRSVRTSSQPPMARNSMSRPTALGRTSVLASGLGCDARVQRKSVCQTVLAGLKNFRRSIAGASNVLLHGSSTGSFASLARGSRATGCSRSANPSSFASPSPLSRSASVDAGAGASTMLESASPLASGGDIRLSVLNSTRPAPLTENEFEREADDERLPSSPFLTYHGLRLPPSISVPPNTSSSLHQSPRVDDRKSFSRSLIPGVVSCSQLIASKNSLLNQINDNSLNRNSASSCVNITSASPREGSPCSSQSSTTPRELQRPKKSDRETNNMVVGNQDKENIPFAMQVSGSTMSLTSWDSVFTLDGTDRISSGNVCSGGLKASTGSAVWETASHLGIITQDDSRRSFRLPLSAHEDSKKFGKKPRKHKFGVFPALFQKRSAVRPLEASPRENIDVNASANVATQPGTSSIKPTTSRRESLLRGIFLR